MAAQLDSFVNIVDGGTCSVVAVTHTSATLSAVLVPATVATPQVVRITPTADMFVRAGENPTAVNTGVDLFLRANTDYRAFVMPGHRLSFITPSGTGNVYLAVGA